MSLWCQFSWVKASSFLNDGTCRTLCLVLSLSNGWLFKVGTENGNKPHSAPRLSRKELKGPVWLKEPEPPPSTPGPALGTWDLICTCDCTVKPTKPHNLFKFILVRLFLFSGSQTPGKFSANFKAPRQDFTCDFIKFSILLNMQH